MSERTAALADWAKEAKKNANWLVSIGGAARSAADEVEDAA